MKPLDTSPSDPEPCDAVATPCIRISVIIPVLDEAGCLGARLAELDAIPGIHERIVVDGDSRDGTVKIARSMAGAQVIAARK